MPTRRRILLYLRASGESEGATLLGEAITLIMALHASGREVQKGRRWNCPLGRLDEFLGGR